jgi:hydrogenase expression/formation protein HypC
MCLAVPMKVTKIEGKNAVVEQEGVSRTIRIDFVPGVAPGQYVLVHAGMAIEQVNEQEAAETLELIKAITDEIHR